MRWKRFPYLERLRFSDSDAEIVVMAILDEDDEARREWRLRVAKLNQRDPRTGLTEWERLNRYGGRSRQRTNDKLTDILAVWDDPGALEEIRWHHLATRIVLHVAMERTPPRDDHLLGFLRRIVLGARSTPLYKEVIQQRRAGYEPVHAWHAASQEVDLDEAPGADEEPAVDSWDDQLARYLWGDHPARASYLLSARVALRPLFAAARVPRTGGPRAYEDLGRTIWEVDQQIPEDLPSLIFAIQRVDDKTLALASSSTASRPASGPEDPLEDEAVASIREAIGWARDLAHQRKAHGQLRAFCEDLSARLKVEESARPVPLTEPGCPRCIEHLDDAAVPRQALEALSARIGRISGRLWELGKAGKRRQREAQELWRERGSMEIPQPQHPGEERRLAERRRSLLASARQLIREGGGEVVVLALVPQVARVEALTRALGGRWSEAAEERSWERLLRAMDEHLPPDGPGRGGRRRIVRGRR